MHLGEQIYKLRTERNLSQGDLADALEVSRQSVSKWENNSAVPELDKLIKMAQMFGITLDELVSGQEAAPAAPAPEPPIQEPVAPPQPTGPEIVRVQLPTKMLLGLVLICLGALAVILGLALPDLQREESDLLVLLGGCGIIWGIFCLCLRYPQLFCGWATWAGLAVYVFVLMPRWEDQGMLVGLVLLTLAAMLIWTIWAIRSKRVYIPLWLLVMGGLALAFLAVLFVVNAMPPFEAPVEQRPVEIIPPAASKVP